MASTKEQILGTPKENTQSTVPEVAAPPVQRPVPNGGTAPTGNDGNETQVNDGSAVVGAPATVPGGAVTPPPSPSSPANANDGTAGSEAPEAPQPKKMSYFDMFQRMSPYKPPTAEELENARKKEKRDKVFAAIGDGIAALSNLYFTTKGAPNAFDPRNSLSAKARERWDKLNKEREENARYYMQEAMKAQALDDDRADKDRSYMQKLQNDYRNYLLKLSADNRAAELHDLDKQLRQGKINEQTYKAKKAEVEAKYADENQKSVIAKNKAAANASNASANASNASAEEHRTNARGRFQWWDENGNVHYAKTQEEAITKARQHGTLDSETVDTTTSSDVVRRGKVTGEKQKKTTSKKVYYPGIRQKHAASQPAAQPSKPAPKPKPKPQQKPSGGKQGGGWASGLTL